MFIFTIRYGALSTPLSDICHPMIYHRITTDARHTWCRHQMETFSAWLVICAGNSPVTGEFPAQRPVTRSFGVLSIYVWINGWVNNREAGDLRRHRAHYDVIVMKSTFYNPVYILRHELVNERRFLISVMVSCRKNGKHSEYAHRYVENTFALEGLRFSDTPGQDWKCRNMQPH